MTAMMITTVSFINDGMLAASDSLAASVLVKVTLTTLLALAIVQLARRSRASVQVDDDGRVIAR